MLLLVAHSTLVAAPRAEAKRTALDVVMARKLAVFANEALDLGEVLRAYMLLTEAAKRDPATLEYKKRRDAIAGAARLVRETELEIVDIRRDLLAAEKYAHSTLDEERRSEIAAEERREEASSIAKPAPPAVPPAPSPAAAPTQPKESPVPAESPSSQAPSEAEEKIPAGTREAVNPLRFIYSTQVLTYGTYSSVRSNTPFNPQNLLAALPSEDSHLAIRPDLSLGFSVFSFAAKPRLDVDHPFPGSTHTLNAYMQEWRARMRLSQTLTVSYGREVLMWGPSMSVPASNPFFIDNGRNTPLIEVGAREFGRLIWQPNTHFAVSYIANTKLARGTSDFIPFQRTAALKADYVGNSLLLSGIYADGLTQPFGPRKFIGGYVQKAVGQAVRLYVEGSAQQGNFNLFPNAVPNPVGWQWSQSSTNTSTSLRPRTIVGGMAYTDLKGGTWTGEYIYNPFGYSNLVAASYYAMAQDLSSDFLQRGPAAGLAASELADARNPTNGLLLRRHYAFAQYQRNGLPGKLDLLLRYTLNADDRSGQGVLFVTWNTNNHLQLFVVFAGLNGSADTEFARYLRYQAQVGVRVFLH